MTIHQCPKCELRFEWNTELDDHCRQDHPDFRHDYPARALPQSADPAPPARPAEPSPGTAVPRHRGDAFVRWLVPRQRGD